MLTSTFGFVDNFSIKETLDLHDAAKHPEIRLSDADQEIQLSLSSAAKHAQRFSVKMLSLNKTDLAHHQSVYHAISQ